MMLSDVCLSVTYTGPMSRTERPRKTKIGTEVAHVIRDSDFTFKVKRTKVEITGVGMLWRPPTQLVSFGLHLLLDWETEDGQNFSRICLIQFLFIEKSKKNYLSACLTVCLYSLSQSTGYEQGRIYFVVNCPNINSVHSVINSW